MQQHTHDELKDERRGNRGNGNLFAQITQNIIFSGGKNEIWPQSEHIQNVFCQLRLWCAHK